LLYIRTGKVNSLPNNREISPSPEYEMMSFINKNTQVTIRDKDAVKMEQNPAYDLSIKRTMEGTDDAVEIQENPAYDVTRL